MKSERTYFNNNKMIQRNRAKEGISLFKPKAVKKTSGILALMMLISILTPILAFAGSWIKDGATYQNGTVSGVVYTDDLNATTVDVQIFDGNNLLGTVSNVTYSTYADVNGVTYKYFDFSYNPSQYYSQLTVVTDGVYGTVTNLDSPPSGGGGFWGGGGGVTSGNEINVPANGQVSSGTLTTALNTYSNVILNLSGEFAIIPASAVLNADGKTITAVANNGASYTYPINVDLINEWAAELGINASDMNITIYLEKVTGSLLQEVQDAADALGATLLADPINFRVTASSGSQTIEITDMGQFVNRTLVLDEAADAGKSTGVVYNQDSASFSFVPSTFATQGSDHSVNIARHSNSIYTAIEYTRNFSDVLGHWAKSDIELLTNKLIVNGMTASTFEPERDVTRAEFAALIVRSLGLSKIEAASTFSDVDASDWFAAEVNAAVAAGIVDGYPDGTFKPNNQINREELAAMVVRALNFSGLDTSLTALERTQILSGYADSNSIVWAHAEIAAAIDAGIVNGMTATSLAPRDDATRAQSTTMIKRFLTEANFIN